LALHRVDEIRELLCHRVVRIRKLEDPLRATQLEFEASHRIGGVRALTDRSRRVGRLTG
jgi:hypothetical protein